MTTWLILGARGQLGTCMQEALTSKGLPFVALGSDECDVRDASAVTAAIRDHSAGIVVNCSAWTAVDAAEDNEDAAYALNCDAVGSIASACRASKSLLVHVSTDYVFPGVEDHAYDESSPTGPVSVYGQSKLCGEQRALSEHPAGTYIVRTAWLYSQHGGNFAKTMIRRALAGTAVRVVDDQRGQPTLADDVALHIIDIVTSAAPVGIYHGTNSGHGTWCDFAREIFDLAGAGSALVSPVQTSEYPTRAVRPSNSVLGHGRTVAAGLPEMRPWQDALRASIARIITAVESEENS